MVGFVFLMSGISQSFLLGWIFGYPQIVMGIIFLTCFGDEEDDDDDD